MVENSHNLASNMQTSRKSTAISVHPVILEACLLIPGEALDFEKNYRCDRCEKVFSRKAILQDHLNVHDNLKPYVCGHVPCTMAFARKSDMRRHASKHTGAGKEFCEPCEKWFSRRDVYLEHMKSNICRRTEKSSQQSTDQIRSIVNLRATVCSKAIGGLTIQNPNPRWEGMRDMSSPLHAAVAPPTGYHRHTDHGDPFIPGPDFVLVDSNCMVSNPRPPDSSYTSQTDTSNHAQLTNSGHQDFEQPTPLLERSRVPHNEPTTRSLFESILPTVTSAEQNQGRRAGEFSVETFPAERAFRVLGFQQTTPPGELVPNFGCRICDRKHFDSAELRTHLMQHMDDDNGRPRYTCIVCSVSFQHRVELDAHYNATMRLSPIFPSGGCNYCGKKFLLSDGHQEFGRHLRSDPHQVEGVVRGCHGIRLEQKLALSQRIRDQIADMERLASSFLASCTWLT
jgi:hypothetical protein